MTLRVVGCSHHNTPIELRERLAFSPEQTCVALERLRDAYPQIESVLLSTCNRTELYTACEETAGLDRAHVADFLAQFHGLSTEEIAAQFYDWSEQKAVEHLFAVATSLDSMVVGEPQILSQVKQAYQLATQEGNAGPRMHAAFQAALKAARRVASETDIHQHRVSVPSVAVADFASQIFEDFSDKNTLVIGAGQMGEETLRYLQHEGAHRVTVVNRSARRATELAQRWRGRPLAWEQLEDGLVEADLVVSTTSSEEPVITREQFRQVETRRRKGPLFILDLAVPRDFDPAIGEAAGVYLYSIDDLQAACQTNRRRRDKQLPAATRILEQETARFMADVHHQATGPVIRQLKQGWEKSKEVELRRLLKKLPELDPSTRDEIQQSFDRLVNKLLHPPLESLRDESRHGIPSALLEALARLFQLKD